MNNTVFQFLSKVRINPLFWMIIGLSIITGHFREIIWLFLAVFIHEMGHYAGAHLFQWRVKKIELFPFGGVAEVEEHGNRPFREEVIVTLLGPVQHLWLMLAAFFIFQLGWWNPGDYEWFIKMNVTLLVFNLLPVWPLDGGKLMFAAAASIFPFKKAQTVFLLTSFSIMLILFVSFIHRDPLHLNLWFVAIFLGVSHYMEWKRRQFVFLRFLMSRIASVQPASALTKPIHVPADAALYDVISLFRKGVRHFIVIQISGRSRIVEEKQVLSMFFSSNQVRCAIGHLFR
ncbi:M50 family metallopeptidase [Fictibacillus sp. NRS-1165]|uniref:M50 family metallopeptidase n=1 Tax=Fictibacillus sp. NRS-1165 TaxID=3144463 RepID=UPI003D1B6BA1